MNTITKPKRDIHKTAATAALENGYKFYRIKRDAIVIGTLEELKASGKSAIYSAPSCLLEAEWSTCFNTRGHWTDEGEWSKS